MNVGDLSGWGLKAWDFDEFHQAELPARLESGVNDKVTWDLECAPPFSITLPDGRAYSYASIEGKVQITPGIHADAQCVIEIQERAWQNYVLKPCTFFVETWTIGALGLLPSSVCILDGRSLIHHGLFCLWTEHP